MAVVMTKTTTALATVISLDLRNAGVRWYVARLNLTGGAGSGIDYGKSHEFY